MDKTQDHPFGRPGWFDFLGPTVESTGADFRVQLSSPDDRHLNHNGSVAGPVLVGLAEIAAGAALVSASNGDLDSTYFVVSSLAVRFLAPSRGATSATARPGPEMHRAWADTLTVGEGSALVPTVVRELSTDRVVAEVDVEFTIRQRRDATRG